MTAKAKAASNGGLCCYKPIRRCYYSAIMRTLVLLVAMVLIGTAQAQQASSPSASSTRTSAVKDVRSGNDVFGYANVFAGPAFATGGSTQKLAGTAGVTLGLFQAKSRKWGFGTIPVFELGIIGPIPAGRSLDGLFSANGVFTTTVPHHEAFPFFTAGYTRVFATGHAINFGTGIDLGNRKSDRLIRIEFRDYYLFTSPQQNIVELRMAFGSAFSDN